MNWRLAYNQLLQDRSAIGSALEGDVVMTIVPGNVNRTHTSSAWTRTVNIYFKTAAGKQHTWFHGTFPLTLTIADTSVAGTASIVSTTLTVREGHAQVVVSGNAADWLAGDTDTLTVAAVAVPLTGPIAGGTSVQTFV